MDEAIRWKEGTVLPARDMLQIDRTTLALFAGGSGDHNPLHLDPAFALEKGGLDDVIGHGMLTMALMGRYITDLAPQKDLLSFRTRFTAQSHVGDTVMCRGTVTALIVEDSATFAHVELRAARATGEPLAEGAARIRLA